jgi:hypothetical protein
MELERKARIKELMAKYPEPWVINKEPHSHNDGTSEFIHVRYVSNRHGEPMNISIGEYLTPDLAELLLLLREAAAELAA